MNLAENGGHIVSSASLYGGTYNQLHYTFPKLGVEVSFIDDPDDLDAWRAAIRPNTKALYGEIIGNPKGDIFDLEGVSAVAHDARHPARDRQHARDAVPLPAAALGADIVVHSATKFIGGHGTSIGGIIVDGGKFDYVASGRFPGFTEPDPSYHGLVFSQLPEELRPAQYILKCRLQYQRDVGPAIVAVQRVPLPAGARDPEPAHGASLAERAGGRAVARGARRGRVGEVPGAGVEPVERARQEVPAERVSGAIVAFGIKGGLEAGQKFVDALELHSHLANVGDVRSLAIHPATTTHPQLEPERADHHRGHPRPRAPVGGHRVARRHPRRPRGGLPRREVLIHERLRQS